MLKRIIFSGILLVSILFFPFWISVILGFLGIIFFRRYWEVVILFAVSDLIFGSFGSRFIELPISSTISSLIILILIELFKKKLKFYNK